jgi:hypothetical protein
MSCAIPEEKFLREDLGSQHEGRSGDLRPNNLSVGGTQLVLQEEVVF